MVHFSLNAQTGVRINEVFAHNNTVIYRDGSISDWVELYNTTTTVVDLSNASLTDNTDLPRKWVFPNGVKIEANSFLVILLDNTEPVSVANGEVLNAGFALKSAGDKIFFFNQGGSAQIDGIAFGIQAADFTIGRIPDGSGAWGLNTPTPNAANISQTLGSITSLKVNEWMASPKSGDDYFEVYNSSPQPVQLTGLYLTDDVSDKTKSPIPTLSYIGTGLGAYATFFADSKLTNGADHVAFKISGSGDSIGLYGGRGFQVDLVEFGQQTNGVSQGRLLDGEPTIVSFTRTASPGEPNYVLLDNLVINELLAHTDPPLFDAVEIFNTTSTAVNIGGWYLSNKGTDLKRYRVPDNTIVPANGYYVFYEDQFNGPNAAIPFTFNSAHGDEVYLAQAINGQLTGYQIRQKFDASENGVSFGRLPTSVLGDFKFVPMSRRTFGVDNPATVEEFRGGTGAPNSGAKVGPLVINEIMFKPLSADGVTDNTADEYVELYNVTGVAVPLYDPAHQTNRWRLRGGVSFNFPLVAIPPFGHLLVVSFDPVARPDLKASFASKFGVPANIGIYGPFSGKLSNGGDEVNLNKPDEPQSIAHPDVGFVPYIRVDRVNFDDEAPWVTGADGTGKSLQKKNPFSFGNDPINWDAAAPTAGRANSTTLLDSDQDGITDEWERANLLNPNDPSDAAQDADGDGFTNLQEYVAGTDPRGATSRLSIGQILINQGVTFDSIIRFTAQVGKSYTVQYRNSLAPSEAWQNLGDIAAENSVRTAEVRDSKAFGKSQRFYRVVTPGVN